MIELRDAPVLSSDGVTSRSMKDWVSLIQKTAGVVNARDYGVLGDGSTDDTAALVLAKNAAGSSKTLVIDVKARLAGAAGTISCPVRFDGGGAFDLTAGGSVTLSGPVSAPESQIFFVSALSRPVNSTFTQGAGTLANGTYWYRVVAKNAKGSSFPSTETSFTVAGGPAGVNVNWAAVSGATGYDIYGRSAGAELLIGSAAAGVTTFLDGGSVTPNGAIPATDTTTGLAFAAKTPETMAAWWGAVGNSSTDDTAALQAALWASQNGTLRLTGTHRITSPLIPPQNVRVVGSGPLFGTGFLADGTAVMQIYGTNQVGGFAFRFYMANLTVQFSNAPAGAKYFDINTAYSIDFDHVKLSTQPDNTTGFSVVNCNDVNLRKVIIQGATGTTHTGVFVQGVGTTSCTVRLVEPDIEALHIGVQVFGGGRVDLLAPYMERNGIGIDNHSATGSVRTYGGEIFGINSGTFCIEAATAGSHTSVYGTRLDPGSGTHTLHSAASGMVVFWQNDQTGETLNGTTNSAGDITAALLGFSPPSTVFASLGTPPNNTVVFCTDATSPSSPATGGGTGALCVRQNGIWKAL